MAAAFARPLMGLRAKGCAGLSSPVLSIGWKRRGGGLAALLFVPRLCAGSGCQRTGGEKRKWGKRKAEIIMALVEELMWRMPETRVIKVN